jgi:hypothetical protein
VHAALQDWRRGTRWQRRLLALLVVPCTAALLGAVVWVAWRVLALGVGLVWGVFSWLLWDPPVTSVILQSVTLGALTPKVLCFSKRMRRCRCCQAMMAAYCKDPTGFWQLVRSVSASC